MKSKCVCDNCDWKGKPEDLDEIDDLLERITGADDIIPAGQCPECGALAFEEPSRWVPVHQYNMLVKAARAAVKEINQVDEDWLTDQCDGFPKILAVFPPQGPSLTFSIVAFTMHDPARLLCEFETVDGQTVLVKDSPIMAIGGNLDSLPKVQHHQQPAMLPTREWLQAQRN